MFYGLPRGSGGLPLQQIRNRVSWIARPAASIPNVWKQCRAELMRITLPRRVEVGKGLKHREIREFCMWVADRVPEVVNLVF